MKVVGDEIVIATEKWRYARHLLERDDGVRLERDYLDHNGSVVIVPVSDDGRILVERIYRHTIDAVSLELPAGTMDRGEEPLATARRELEEETGHRAADWRHVFWHYPALGLANEKMHVFVARGLTKTAAAPMPDESIEIELIEPARLHAMAAAGSIRDGKTLIALWALGSVLGVASSAGGDA